MDWKAEKAEYEKQLRQILGQLESWTRKRFQVEGVLAFIDNKLKEAEKEEKK